MNFQRFLWCLICLFFYPALFFAQDRQMYNVLSERYKNFPLDQIARLGDEHFEKQNTDTAIILYSVVFAQFHDERTEEEKHLCALCYLKTGNICFSLGNYNYALEFYIKGLKISESCKYKKEIPEFYKKIGNVYCFFQDYEEGVEYYTRGYRLCRLYPNKEMEFDLLTNLSGIYSLMKDTKKAKIYFNLREKIKLEHSTLHNYLNLLNKGLILSSESKYDEAVNYFRLSAGYAHKRKLEPRYECSSYEHIYRCYFLAGQKDSAIYYLRLYNRIAEKNGMMHMFSFSLKYLSEYYEWKGDAVNSLRYKARYLSLTDSIFNVREFSRIKNMQLVYETEKTEKELSVLYSQKKQKEQELNTQRKIMAGILTGFLIISCLLALVYKQKRSLMVAYRNLFNVNSAVVASEKWNKELRLGYEDKLLQKDLLIEQLKERGGSSGDNDNDDGNETRNEEQLAGSLKAKYQDSNLADNQKYLLADAVRNVMETTQEYCKEEFSLDRLAELVNSNSKYVSQVINETFQMNFSTFVNEYRIRQARTRLMDTECYGNYTIKAIAESVGYKSYATFIIVFRKITGMTPSMYQRMAKEQTNKYGFKNP